MVVVLIVVVGRSDGGYDDDDDRGDGHRGIEMAVVAVMVIGVDGADCGAVPR